MGRAEDYAKYGSKMINCLREILSREFPVLLNRDKWSDPSGVSGPSKSRGRGGHFGGMIGKKLVKQKAADIYLDANKPYEQSLGDLLFKYFIEDRELLGIDFVVWDQQKSQGGKVRSYPLPPNTCEIAKTGEKAKPWEKKSCLHRDHIHVEFKSREADEDHSSALMNTVAKVKKALAQQTP